jgi:hypothetical protein
MAREVAGYLLEEQRFADGVSTIWHARSATDPSQRATVRVFDIPEGGDLAGPLFAFREDTEAATALPHDHLVTTLDVGWRGADHTYVVSPYMPVVPLRDHLRGGPLGAGEALRLLRPLSAALDMAAGMDLPHGAVHPLSIWVAPSADEGQPRALLSGFGLHHMLRVLAVRHREGPVIDDFLYIAPELLRGGRPTDRSDQYALAGALLHAVTGHPPYERDSLSTLFNAHLFSPAGGDASSQTVAGNDEAFVEIMKRGLAKNPDHRFESCQQFVATVAQWWHLAEPPEPVAPVAPVAPSEPVAPPEPVAPVAPVAPPQPDAPIAPPEPVARPAEPSVTAPEHAVRPLQVQPRRRRRARTRVVVLAAVGAVVGVIAALVVLSRIRPPAASAPPVDGPPPVDGALAATSVPSPPSEVPPGVRWRQDLPAPASDLYVTSVGVVAVTSTQVVVVDPDSGGVLDHLDASEPTTVTDEGGLVTATADGLRVHDIQDGSLQWQSEITGVRPPAVAGGTLYGVSGDSVPQLIVTDAQSGQRLWEYPGRRLPGSSAVERNETTEHQGEEPAFPADTAVAPSAGFVYLADSQVVYGVLPKGETVEADTRVVKAGKPAPEPLGVWRSEVGAEVWLSTLRAVADGVVIADRTGNVCMRAQADGKPVWCLRVRGADGVEPAVFTTDTQVYVVTPTAVSAIDARTGRQQWVQEGEWGDAVLGAGRLVVIAADGTIAALSTANGQVQTLDVTTGTGAPAAIAVDGDMLYAALDDGALVNVDMAAQPVRR